MVGDEFAVAAVAAGLDAPVESVEDECETLAAQEMVIADDGLAEWPDGTISGRYRFVHALYRQVLHDGIGESRRARLHRAVGERLEAALGAHASQHAAELAMHFTRGRDHARALRHHEAAAMAALHRSAHQRRSSLPTGSVSVVPAMIDHRRDTDRGSTAPATMPAALPADRAFVVQIRADADLARGDVRGRIEHVTSGSVTIFESLDELLSSMRAAVAGKTSFVNEGER